MARPTKKAISKAQEASKIIDRLSTEVDANLLIVGTLGGIAAAGGIVPPFTRLLMTVGGAMNVPDIGIDYAQLSAAALSPMALTGGGAAVIFGSALKNYFMQQGDDDAKAEAKAKTIGSTALFASGALEAMLMYKAFSSPDIMKAVIGAPGEIIKGIGAIVPG